MSASEAEQVIAWVEAAQGGSQPAFAALHRRFARLVYGVLLARFRPAIAEELTQECFLLAARKLTELREPASFGAWIATIARRMRTRDRVHEPLLDEYHDIPQPGSDPEISLDAERVLLAIHTLPETYREVLVLRLVEGMSGKEIAQLTGLTPESVRVNLHRGLIKLRSKLRLQSPASEVES